MIIKDDKFSWRAQSVSIHFFARKLPCFKLKFVNITAIYIAMKNVSFDMPKNLTPDFYYLYQFC